MANSIFKIIWLTFLTFCVSNVAFATTLEECITTTPGLEIKVTNDSSRPWVVKEEHNIGKSGTSVESMISFTNMSSVQIEAIFYLYLSDKNSKFLYSVDGINFVSEDETGTKNIFVPANQTIYLKTKNSCIVRGLKFYVHEAFVQKDGTTWMYRLYEDHAEVTSCLPATTSVEMPCSFSFNGIDYPVTTFQKGIFTGDSFESITIPESVETIQNGAFAGCSSLKRIVLPFIGCYKNDRKTNCLFGYIFGENEYSGSYKVQQYRLYNNTLYVANFQLPSSLETVIITGGDLPEGAFRGCFRISEVVLSMEIEKINNNAFKSCTGLKSVEIPMEITTIGNNAFDGCSNLNSITVPKGVVSIGDYAFSGCNRLGSVSLPNDLRSIGIGAFSGCAALTAISIPHNITQIRDYTFRNCTNIESIILPEGLNTLGLDCLRGCSKIKELYIPQSVTTIAKGVLDGLDSLCELTIPFLGKSNQLDTYDEHKSIGYLFNESSASRNNYYNINVQEMITSSSWRTRVYQIPESLTSVTVLGGKVRESAFQGCKSLKSICISNDIKYIERGADSKIFSGCSSLEKLTMPLSGVSISVLPNLKELVITHDDIYSGLHYTGFNNLSSLEKLTVSGITKLGQFNNCVSLKEVNIIECTSLSSSVFTNCNSLKELHIPEGCTSIDDGTLSYSAFQGCTSLEKVYFPSTMELIGDYSFRGCSRLNNIVISANVHAIGEHAFTSCSGLTDLSYCGTKEQWELFTDRPTFEGTRIHFNYGCTEIGEAFLVNGIYYIVMSPHDKTAKVATYEKKYEGDLFIPTSVILNGVVHKVTAFDNNVFKGCDHLTSISYEGTKLQWEKIVIGKGNELLSTIPIKYNCISSFDDVDEPSNYIYADKQTLTKGTNEDFHFSLRNKQEVTGFQFELELPEGIELVEYGDKYSVELLTERTTKEKHNIFDVTKLSNGRYLIICSSTSNSVFSEHDGELLSLRLNVANELEDGEYKINLHNIAFSTPTAEVYRTKYMEMTLTIESAIRGDVDKDRYVTKDDVIALENHLLGNTPEQFSIEAADVNKNGQISIEDLTKIVDILINQ